MSFPVWRELKLCLDVHSCSVWIRYLTMSFPVWRELKRTLQDGRNVDLVTGNLQCPFPFEGNWNWNPQISSRTLSPLQCPFPFEGNWNPVARVISRVIIIMAYNVLSRLKGIETFLLRFIVYLLYRLTMSFPVWRELKHIIALRHQVFGLHLQCPFPFEGNWNSGVADGKCPFKRLTMSFPVWRELKLSLFKWQLSANILQCPFPFEGNWNLLSIAKIMFSWHDLQCPFPFEGNWNNCIRCDFGVFISYNVLSRLKGIETLA